MSDTMVPVRPKMPNDDDEARCLMTAEREALLLDNAEKLASDYLIAKAGDEKAALLGLPDLSANPIASVTRQLSTPGLYGVQPEIANADAGAVAILLEQAGLSGWLPKMQRVQYLALGLGQYLVRFDVPPSVGHLTARLVSPSCVVAEGTPDLPDVPVEIRELRIRWYQPEKKWRWTWDEYSIRDRKNPYYRVVSVSERADEPEEDLSSYYLDAAGALQGEAYPYRYEDGSPFLPWVVYRAAETGKLWDHLDKRGATIGTLNTIVYSTYVGHTALGASGRSVLCVGMAPVGDVREAPSNAPQTTRPRSITVMPGSWIFAQPTGDQTPMAQEIGPGADLDVLSGFALAYEAQQAVRAGLNPSDATRSHANPTSGAALAISNRGRREFAEQVTPVFRPRDLEAIRKIAALLRISGVAALPEAGWSVVYHRIPDSPEEAREEREDLQWQQAQGYLSKIDVYTKLHPGCSRETALLILRRIQADEAALDQSEPEDDEPTPEPEPADAPGEE